MKTLTRWLGVALIGSMLSTGTHAQKTTFRTYATRNIITAEGELRLPFTVNRIRAEELDKFRLTMIEYSGYMNQLVSDALGRRKTCHVHEQFFLPGSTEASFHKAEAALTKAFTVGNGDFPPYRLLKTYPVRKLTTNVIGSFYVYRPTKRKSGDDWNYLHGYFFDRRLGQGLFVSCTFFPNI